jgi:hypothetical protein
MLIGCLSLALAAAAAAQIRPITPVARLSAPVAIAPTPVLFAYQYGAPNLSFVWEQYPAFASPFNRLPTHFLLCLQRLRDGDCTHANAVANVLPSQVPSVPLNAPPAFFPIGYRYTYTPTIPDGKLDDLVKWSVGACTGNTDSSCLFSAHAWMAITTVDMRADNVSGNVQQTSYEVSASGTNLGSRSAFSIPASPNARVSLWDVLFDGANVRCRTDPNAADIRNESTLLVINHKGVLTRFADLPRDAAGNYIASNVIAIYRPNSTYSYTLNDVSLEFLSPGVPQQVGTVSVQVPVNTRPRAFASAVVMDVHSEIYEANETDNGHAECEVVF